MPLGTFSELLEIFQPPNSIPSLFIVVTNVGPIIGVAL